MKHLYAICVHSLLPTWESRISHLSRGLILAKQDSNQLLGGPNSLENESDFTKLSFPLVG